MAAATETRIALSVGPLGEADLPVRALAGEEELSRPYRFQVDAWSGTGEPLELADLLGAPATLRLSRPGGEERVVSGVVCRAELGGRVRGRAWYRVSLVPRLELLGLRVRSRIFQGLSVPEVVAAVLDEAEVPHRLALSRSYPPRELVAQHRESSLAFVSRLLEEEGVWFRFEEGDGGEVVVIADASTAFEDLPGGLALPFADHDSSDDQPEHLFELRRTGAVVPEASTQSDFDFEHPALAVCATAGDRGSSRELFEHPSGARAAGAAASAARCRLDEAQVAREGFELGGTCLRLAPGHRFEPEAPPDPAAEQLLVAVRVVHEGRQEESAGGELRRSYRNEVRAVPAAAPWRPPRRTPRPVAPGLETATVVVPSGEEIHPDRYGRIKVRLHWDREGPSDDGASCWVRTAQAWAGPGYGALCIPRVGQEVVLRFLDGDPDRPLVEGAVYDGERRPPAELPHDRTQTVFRSESSPGGGGHNELRLEDAAGAERVHVHAQKDALTVVLHDATAEVRHDARLEVANDRTQTVDGFHGLRVEGNDTTTVVARQTLRVDGPRETRAPSHAETVLAAQSVNVGGEQSVKVSSAKVVTVKGVAALTAGGAYLLSVGGMSNVAVGGARLEEVGGERLLQVGGDHRIDVAGSCEQKVGGDAERVVAGSCVTTAREADESFGAAATTKVAGRLTLGAKELRLEGGSGFSLAVGGKKLWAATSSGMTLKVTSLTVKGDELTFKGSSLVKEAPGSAADQKAEELKQFPVELELVDQDGEPLEGEPFRVEFPDGWIVDGVTGEGGKATALGTAEGQAKVSFPRLDEKAWDKA